MAQTAPTQTATPPAAPAGATPNMNSATIPPGDASREEALAGSVSCTGCHGPMGVSVSPEFPRLAGQHPDSLTGQLLILRAGIRPSQITNRVAAKLSDQDISDLLAYFTAQRRPGRAGRCTGRRGAKRDASGALERPVIACAVCHGDKGMGVNDLQIAVIRHQLPEYAVSVMNECKNLSTNGTPLSTAMSLEMKPLSDQRNSIGIRLIPARKWCRNL